ncbi:MAG: FG-GAP repeat protein [Proteobacteria bacterium]|nr:FG-GAP repeat protein [Pseudomonadota bacterium]
MKKEITITALCVALAALSGCSGSDNQAQSNEDIATHSQALFGETGGLPYGSAEAAFIVDSAPANEAYFGRALAVGHINPNKSIDIVTSTGSTKTHGRVIVAWDNNSSQSVFEISPKGKDDFGAAIAVGKFCPNLTSDDIIIASAPSYSSYKGAFGFIYKDSTRYRVAKKIIYGGTNKEIAGGAFAIGDVDGDGNNDIVFRSSPIDDDDNWEKTKVNVMLDICNAGTNMVIADSVEAESEDFMLGSAIYIADLDGTGTNEIVVVDNLFRADDNAEYSPNGAIFFYKFSGGKLVESRTPIIGDLDKAGASIEAVAFSDINHDGKLDLIVGEPMWNNVAKREGRVRTYTNLGASAGFDDTSLWTKTSGRSNARFGSSVTIADLNHDGVDDLIVGAPGIRPSDTDKAQGDVYIYMGTKDGTIFSKEAFWTYNSNVPTSLNDDFGRNVVVTDVDSAGWDDLVVAAPNYSPDSSNPDQGRLSVFSEKDDFCYAASRCLVDGVCFEAGETLDGDKCQFCDPSQHNFEWSEVSCSGAETECQSAATCDPSAGCTMINKPDGTACGSPSCDKDNNYVTNACTSGVCKPTTTTCSGYGCDASSGCLTGCSTNEDCQDGFTCQSGQCVNLPPTITLAANYTLMLGETITIKPTIKDPEGDKFTFSWTVSPTTNVTANYTDTLNPRVHAGNNAIAGDKMTLTLDVTDAAGNTVSATTTVTIKGIDLVMTSPQNHAALEDYTVVFSGTTSLGSGKGSIIVTSEEGEPALCTATIQADGSWSCSYTYDTPGNQGAFAYWSRNSKERTDEVIFSFVDPKSSLSITSPTDGQILTDPKVTIAGKIDSYITYINGGVLVETTNGQNICKATISYNSWSCTTNLEPGSYQIVAYKDDNVALKSSVVNFTIQDPISANNPPIILVNPSFNVEPGGSVRLNASKSYDPDGDPITFSWSGADVSRLSNATSKYPMFYAPEDAVPGTEYHVTVTVADDKKATASSNITIYVISPDYNIEITSPTEGEVINTETFAVSGTTDMPNGQKIIVTNVDTNAVICTAEVVDKAWSCESSLSPDQYTIVATWAGDSKVASSPVHFEIASSIPFNQPPVIILQDHYEAQPYDVFVLDASSSYDPDGDTISFEWSGEYISMLSGTHDSTPIVSIPDSVEDGDELTFTLTVTDDKGASAEAETTVFITKQASTYFVEITDPAQNVSESVERSNPITITGKATPDVDIWVLDTETNALICQANSDPIDGNWNCTTTLNTGDYAAQAFAVVDSVEVAHSGISKFTILDNMSFSTPVILTPANGEITSIRPTASGTVNATDGKVYVWIVEGNVSTLFCESEIVDNKWICTVGYNLENATEYTIRANWSDGVDQSSTMSEPVTFTTQGAEVSQISIKSPADGSVLSASKPVIFTGTADPDTQVDVYVDGMLACTAVANENKYWACTDIYIGVGLHEAYADDGSDDKIIPSKSVFFTIEVSKISAQSEYNNASGGSCSISTPSNAGHFGWLFLLAGFAGLGIVRRRKA